MKSADDDVLDLLDHAWARLNKRMDGLSDDEWAWRPIDTDAKVTIRWRLAHIAGFLSEPRNWAWLGSTARPRAKGISAHSATEALGAAAAAYASFRASISTIGADLGSPIGPAAGQFADATRRSFVLHIADELIHHGAEAALIRDLYAASACQ